MVSESHGLDRTTQRGWELTRHAGSMARTERLAMLRPLKVSVVCVLGVVSSWAWAGIPEPDAVLYGNAYVEGFPVLQQDAIRLVARLETGPEVGRYDFADCNGDGVRDICELSCARPGCSLVPGCGTAHDDTGRCASGPSIGRTCLVDVDCGACSAGSSNAGAPCDADTDCTGGTCALGDCSSDGLLDDCPGDLYALKVRCESTPDGLAASGSAAVLNPSNPTVVRILMRSGTGPEQFVRNLLISERGKIRQLALSVLNRFAFRDYANCQRGPAVTTPGGSCAAEFFTAADYDEDGDVDLRDYAFIQNHFVGQ